jgi:16S rRNA (uracil1498-N3)-methyltransferase
MRLHNFFIDRKIGDSAEFIVSDESLIHQWQKVFRYIPGDKLVLFDGSGLEFISRISTIEKKRAILEIEERRGSRTAPAFEVWLYQSLIKKDNFETVVQKATEIGVSHIVPLVSERTEKKDFNVERVQKIMREACEQSGRALLPTLHDAISFEEAVQQAIHPSLAFHVTGEQFERSKALTGKEKQLSIFIGPEGGWSDTEVNAFTHAGIPLWSLGAGTLRAETAAVVATALVLLQK